MGGVRFLTDSVFVELKNITKIFPGVTALDDVSISLNKGQIHGLVGENGAGKSTLIKVLSGVYRPEKGDIYIEGKPVKFANPLEARQAGIACVHQELSIVKNLSITDNLFVGDYVKDRLGLLDYKYMNSKAKAILEEMGQDFEPTKLCGALGMGQQQMVEIGKAILINAKLIIFDEPTSSLGEKEAELLFDIIRKLKEKGIAILFVSHKLEEIFELCDLVTVMRDGKHVVTVPAQEVTKDQLISYMVGRTLNNMYPKVPAQKGEIALEVKNMSSTGRYKNINFKAHYGEILGFAGLVGSGRTELFRGIFGIDSKDSGEIYINGKKCSIKNPVDAINNKIAFLTEDRKIEGLILSQSIRNNLCLVNLASLKKGAFLDENKINQQAENCVSQLRIKTNTIYKIAGELSGGNQQKVVIGKWTNADADIFIFDEPTRGIDVGAKIEVYNIMNELVKKGKCVIMISSELQEILGMSDRVIVMRRGKIMAEIDRTSRHFNQEDIMKAAWGGTLT
jgi:ribose transport system ATP-binding protein